jgi:hypothetical protein
MATTTATACTPKNTKVMANSSSSSSSSITKIVSSIYSFQEGRRIARGHGFESKDEFLEYSCPGAYKLPENPHEVWGDEWKGWEDWLGICYDFEEGRRIARGLGMKTMPEYISFKTTTEQTNAIISIDDDPAGRLPLRPDLKYKAEWKGWEDWLSGTTSAG